MGVGAASALLVDAYLDCQRTKRSYGPEADMVELTVGPDEIVFATDTRRTAVRRSPKVSVVESNGAFVLTIDKGGAPVLVPARYLAVSETATLRQWITR
jgi:hypothetical protein